ncbi:MAG: NADH-quinone oxidoreductase subunit H [Anaerolineae bacterium]|nr:NADH-quinone oxidoreductase subunit H [Anaerolineae bacterium]
MINYLSILNALGKAGFAILIFPGFGFLFVCAILFAWIDRRMIARLHGRIGPPWYQPLADFIKLMTKEDLLPEGASELSSAVLPILSLAMVLTASLYIPIGTRTASAFEGDLIVVLFLLSIPALAYFLAGWGSVGVYSVIGGNRSLLQFFSYEVPFLMALSGPAILSGSWSISRIVTRQAQTTWAAFVQPVGFMLGIIGLIGKLKRVPFDIPKAKSEVVGGPLTEFSGRKLALWHLSLQFKTVVGIFLLVDVFLGGGSSGWIVFGLKALSILIALSVISALYARLRIDQLITLGWRVLAPLALVQTLFTIWIGGG